MKITARVNPWTATDAWGYFVFQLSTEVEPRVNDQLNKRCQDTSYLCHFVPWTLRTFSQDTSYLLTSHFVPSHETLPTFALIRDFCTVYDFFGRCYVRFWPLTLKNRLLPKILNVSYKTLKNWSRDILSGSRQKLILSTLFNCY